MMKGPSGILEYMLLDLYEARIKATVKVFGTREGLDTQVILEIPENRLAINIIRYDTRLSYYLTEDGEKRRVNRFELLDLIKSLKEGSR